MKKYIPIIMLTFLLGLIQFIGYSQHISVDQPTLFDTDCYMRLVRVEQLYDTHDWYNNVIVRSNSPYGESSHWTHLLDILLLIGAIPLAPILTFKAALFWWGMFISPLLHLASFITLFWVTCPLFKPDSRFRLCLLFLGQPGVWGYFAIGRPDHHSLLLFLFILFLGFAVRMLRRPLRRKSAYLAGLTVATAMWVSVETLAVVAMAWLAFIILWITAKGEQEQYAKQSAAFSLALICGSCFYLLLERPWSQLFVIEYDKLSTIHISIFLLFSVFWIGTILKKHSFVTPYQRLDIFSAFSIASLIGVLLYCPDFLRGPYVAVDARIIPLWLKQVNEVQPLLPFNPEHLSQFTTLLGTSIIVFPYMGWTACHKKVNPVWILWPIGSIIFVALTCYQIRWAAYAETVLLFPLTMLLAQLLQRIRQLPLNSLRKIALNLIITLLFCLAFPLLGSYLMPDKQARPPALVTPITGYLSDPAALGSTSKIILADIDFGPELLYRTPHKVLATPYHRNSSGILFVNDVMSATQDSAAFALLQQRHVDLVLLDPDSHEKNIFNPTNNPNTLYGRLLSGEHPTWLQPLLLPADLQEHFRIFQVIYDETDKS